MKYYNSQEELLLDINHILENERREELGDLSGKIIHAIRTATDNWDIPKIPMKGIYLPMINDNQLYYFQLIVEKVGVNKNCTICLIKDVGTSTSHLTDDNLYLDEMVK